MADSRAVVLRRRPQGAARAEDFDVVDVPPQRPGDGQVVVAARYLSVDPYVRCLLDDPSLYGTPVALGAVPPGDMVGEVVESRDPDLRPGTLVVGRLGWRTHAVADARALRRAGCHGVAAEAELALLGSAGLTAWFGVTETLRPRPGDAVLVTGAAGAVGSLAAQLCRVAGARVVGVAGGARKQTFLTGTLGLDGAIDYQATADIGATLDRACPDGFDGFFDNVGGPIADAALARLRPGARVAVCGEISQYDDPGNEYRPRILPPLMDKRATMAGFLVSDYAHRFDEARARLASLVDAGRLVCCVDVVEGIARLPEAFAGMMRGDSMGKRLVSV
jgi:NADPH-dependent curcumin reductase CurA